MPYELRILSGLHRGATLPLDDQPVEIGASDEAGVVLVDPGIEALHATLAKAGDGWVLTAREGTLLSAEDNRSHQQLPLDRSGFARIGNVWVTLAKEGDPWEDPPPVPVPSAADFEPEPDEGVAAALVQEPAEVEMPAAAPAVGASPRRPRSLRVRLVLSLPFILIGLLSAGAYAIASRSEGAPDLKKINILGDLTGKPPAAATVATAMPGQLALSSPVGAIPPSGNPADEKLRTSFRKRLSDAQLIHRLDLELDNQAWRMRGNLDDAETARFERVLKVFVDENRISFPISAKVVGPEGMLPFKISQVISGANASIVTKDGTRLYVGDEYQGVSVVSIKPSNLVFAGKRKIEVNW